MAKRWTKAFAVLLGVGIPTGTIAGTQFFLLWPGFMEVIGKVMAFPFQIEIYAFFIEALFMSIYVGCNHAWISFNLNGISYYVYFKKGSILDL